jgi:hypothetical protein
MRYTAMKNRTIVLIAFMMTATPILAQSTALDGGDLNALDADGDGGVSKAEFSSFSDYAFKQMDTNRDGSLGATEIDPHLVEDSFKELDNNNDGLVSPDEFNQQMSADFEKSDLDGDGILN